MSKTDLAVKKKHMRDSLNKVATCYSNLCDLSERLTTYTETDLASSTNKVHELISSIDKEEKSIFQELLLLKTNAECYFGKDNLKMIAGFKPYKIIMEATKTKENRELADNKKFCTIVFNEDVDKNIVGYISLNHYLDREFASIDVINDIISIWMLFLQKNTDVNIDSFKEQIIISRGKRSLYSGSLPYGVISFVRETIQPKKPDSEVKKKEKEVIKRNMVDRFMNIKFRYEELEASNTKLSQFTISDTKIESTNYEQLESLKKRIILQEQDLLSELVHLLDNIKKYFKVYSLSFTELDVIGKFNPFSIASNYVNSIKHGIEGKRKTSELKYISYVFLQKGESQSRNDNIVKSISIINDCFGGLVQSDELVEALIVIWRLFLRNHTDLNPETFERILKMISRRNTKAVYTWNIPVSMIDDAKSSTKDRKSLDI